MASGLTVSWLEEPDTRGALLAEGLGLNKMTATMCKHIQMAHLNNVWAPRFSTGDFLPSVKDVKKSRVEWLKIEFSKISKTNEWAGKWMINRRDVMKCKKFNNNGLECYVVPLSKLEPIVYQERCIHLI